MYGSSDCYGDENDAFFDRHVFWLIYNYIDYLESEISLNTYGYKNIYNAYNREKLTNMENAYNYSLNLYIYLNTLIYPLLYQYKEYSNENSTHSNDETVGRYNLLTSTFFTIKNIIRKITQFITNIKRQLSKYV